MIYHWNLQKGIIKATLIFLADGGQYWQRKGYTDTIKNAIEKSSTACVSRCAVETISEGKDFIATIYQAVDMLNQTQLNLTLPINWH